MSDTEQSDTGEDVNIAEKIQTPGIILVCAKKYSGKTVALKWIMEQLIEDHRFDWGYIFSETTDVNHEWDIIPKNYIRTSWHPEDLVRIFNYQMDKWTHG